MQRVAIVYDDSIRPDTTGTYCLRAFQALVREGQLEDVQHLLPTQLEQLKHGSFDACLFVDDGLRYDLPSLDMPIVWWAIDTHMSPNRCWRKAGQANLVFAAQQNGAAQLKAKGIATAQWLPLACDPEIHGRKDVPNQFDVAFVGNFFPGERAELTQRIQENVPRSFLGRADFRRMAEIYSATKIVFNRSLRDDVNMRVFEGLCSGSLLITNDLEENGLEELFPAGQCLVAYRSADELLEQIQFYLEHDDERERIAAAGRELVVQQHTYRHRMEEILRQLREYANSSVPQAEVEAPELLATGPATSRQTGDSDLSVEPTPLTAPPKSRSYYEFDRPDVLELVPQSARRILDVGCGGGRLGATIKQRQQAHVTGIELNSAAVESASQRLDAVISEDIQSGGMEFPEKSFDCVICADVLEHLRDPLAVLRKIRRWLRDDGVLVTSLPNVRNHCVIRSLLAGNWTYESAGLLDEDHVRFFTRREMEKLLFRAGFEVQELRMVGGEGFQEWIEQGSPRQIQMGPLQVHVGSEAEAAEFFAYQYLMASTPAAPRAFGLTSIVLVTHNQWRYTHACLESIRLRTDLPYELIVVDNGSTDGTVEFLEQCDDVILIRNETNRGFPAAANQGIQHARGEQILLLNNDTLVTTGWLEHLLNTLYLDRSIGLVGPVTNNISGEQQISVSYEDDTQLDGFAWDRAKAQQRNVQVTNRLVGFCLLIKTEVIQLIGLLDERFGIGNFEDDDYCRRAIAAGYRCAIAPAAFVHHIGSATFRGSGVNFGKLIQDNKQKYDQKWNTPREQETDSSSENETKLTAPQPEEQEPADAIPRGSSVRPQFLLDVDETGELLLQPNQVKLSACLIVRDNEQTIRPCLESLRPWVDEIVIVDTGSLDRTPQICEELGARVLHSPWQDSFSQARNVSLSLARGEWIFWMDSDDTLPSHCGQELRELVDGDHPDTTMGYIVQVHCPGETADDVTIVDHVKLIRNRPDLRFEFQIHEQILPAIRRAGGEVAWTDLYVVHSGSDKTPAGRVRKLERDFHLLNLDLQDHPDHPFVLFNLGMTHADVGQHEQAIHFLRRCIHVSTSQESHLRKAYALLIGSLNQLHKFNEAQECCSSSLELFPGDKELLFRQAMLQHQSGQLQEAAKTYQRLLTEHEARHFTSIDAGLASHKARHNLAIVYEDMGQNEEAQQQWRTILQQRPDYAPALEGVVRLQRQSELLVPVLK
ncbi:MAG: glycosyltransferase [Planctomycetota bacterium]